MCPGYGKGIGYNFPGYSEDTVHIFVISAKEIKYNMIQEKNSNKMT